jgi:Tfp pilus assembly protein PilO
VRNLSERQRLWVTIGVAVLLVGGLTALIMMDRDEIEVLDGEIAGLDQRIRAADIEIARIPQREDDVLVYRAVEPLELAVLPTEQRIADFHQNLSTFMARAGLAFEELPESRPEPSELASGVFVTRNQIKGRGTAQEILRFLNMVENDPRLIAVKGFQVMAGQRPRSNPGEEAVPAEVEHQLDVHLETYFYEPTKAGPKGITIPGAERRLQEPRLRERIASFKPEKAKTYVLASAASRRDPLVDPRERVQAAESVDLVAERQRQEDQVISLEHGWLAIEELLEQERALTEAGDVLRADHARSRIGELANDLALTTASVVSSGSVRLSDLMERITSIKDKVGREIRQQPGRELVVTRSFAESEFARMEGLLAEARYKELLDRGNFWKGFLERREVQPAAQPVIEQVTRLLERARNLQDWSAFHFDISGAIVHASAPERSLANINGRSYRPGDRLASNEEIEVAEITTTRVWFRFRGERLAVDARSGIAEGTPSPEARRGAGGARLGAHPADRSLTVR